MSNALAIAAVTATLRSVIKKALDPLVPDQRITTKPPDKARSGTDLSNQVNLFMYQTALNAAWRNMDLPGQTKSGETGHPPLALNLHYLVTAYGAADDETLSHQWLGKAMLALHDHPVLSPDDIVLKESGLDTQIERVQISLLPLSLEDMSKLWTAFQTQYRISAAYEAHVVLIESTRSRKTPLPVLTRGQDDSGVTAQPDLIPPFPTITDVRPANGQPSAQPNTTITISGFHLDGDTVEVRYSSARLKEPRIEPATGTAEEIVVTVPDDPTKFPAGNYTVAMRVLKEDEPERFTNEWPLQIAPVIKKTIVSPTPPVGNFLVAVTVSPEVQPTQSVSLLIGDRDVPAEEHKTQTDVLTFKAKKVAAGEYFVRVRVDGVDSVLVDRTKKPPQFDPTQKVLIP